jgi:hypothetical protein
VSLMAEPSCQSIKRLNVSAAAVRSEHNSHASTNLRHAIVRRGRCPRRRTGNPGGP